MILGAVSIRHRFAWTRLNSAQVYAAISRASALRDPQLSTILSRDFKYLVWRLNYTLNWPHINRGLRDRDFAASALKKVMRHGGDTFGPSKILPVAVVDPTNGAQSFSKAHYIGNIVDSKVFFLISFLFLVSVFASSSFSPQTFPPFLSPSVLSALRIREYHLDCPPVNLSIPSHTSPRTLRYASPAEPGALRWPRW